MQRQVTVLGEVSKVGAKLADEYFHSRPYLSRIGAWASHQSQPIDSRESLEKSFLEAQENMGRSSRLPTGAGIIYSPVPSSSGRVGPADFMTALFINYPGINGQSLA